MVKSFINHFPPFDYPGLSPPPPWHQPQLDRLSFANNFQFNGLIKDVFKGGQCPVRRTSREIKRAS